MDHMPKLDHLSVIAPSLKEGVEHVRACLGVDVPFGRKHANMSTHNHLLRLGDAVYLEIIAIDENAPPIVGPRWFDLDNHAAVRKAWDEGRRLRSWVASTGHFDRHMAEHASIYGEKREFQGSASSYPGASKCFSSRSCHAAQVLLAQKRATHEEWPFT